MTNEQIDEQLNRIRITMNTTQQKLLELMNYAIGCANLCEQLSAALKELKKPEAIIEEGPDEQN